MNEILHFRLIRAAFFLISPFLQPAYSFNKDLLFAFSTKDLKKSPIRLKREWLLKTLMLEGIVYCPLPLEVVYIKASL